MDVDRKFNYGITCVMWSPYKTNVGTACLEDFDSLMGTCRKSTGKKMRNNN